jgi:hypothetical protein
MAMWGADKTKGLLRLGFSMQPVIRAKVDVGYPCSSVLRQLINFGIGGGYLGRILHVAYEQFVLVSNDHIRDGGQHDDMEFMRDFC